eukprot:m.694925 g.694925  ORF g.694925 m.694925 type:complete len:320 (-) comp58667_c0_seq16:2844-3803(-)
MKGLAVLFGVALSLLKNSQKELLALGFEEILQYFRVQMPRLYMDDDAAAALTQSAIRLKPSERKLKKFANEYLETKTREEHEQDPVVLLTSENKQLKDRCTRLEADSDKLASDLEGAQARLELSNQSVANLKLKLDMERNEHQEDVSRLEAENTQVKDMYRKLVLRYEEEKQSMVNEASVLKQVAATVNVQFEELQRKHDIIAAENQALKTLAHNPADTVVLQQRVLDLELQLAKCKLALSENEFEKELLHQQIAQQRHSSVEKVDPAATRGSAQTVQPAARARVPVEGTDPPGPPSDRKRWFAKFSLSAQPAAATPAS